MASINLESQWLYEYELLMIFFFNINNICNSTNKHESLLLAIDADITSKDNKERSFSSLARGSALEY